MIQKAPTYHGLGLFLFFHFLTFYDLDLLIFIDM